MAIIVTALPLLLAGLTFVEGDEVPPDVWAQTSVPVRERLIASRRVDGAPNLAPHEATSHRASTILDMDDALKHLSNVGAVVPPGTARRLVWFAHRVIIDGHPIEQVAEQYNVHAILGDWVPAEFRNAVNMKMRRILNLQEAGARPELLDPLLTNGVVNTTDENTNGRVERLPTEERIRTNQKLVEEQLADFGELNVVAPVTAPVPVVASKPAKKS